MAATDTLRRVLGSAARRLLRLLRLMPAVPTQRQADGPSHRPPASRSGHPLGRAVGGLLGGLVATGGASGATLPEDRAELLLHHYDGGGVSASGPAVFVRKALAGRVSLSGTFYVDAVSNASVDVVTTASPYRETRRAADLSLATVVRDATITLGAGRSREPDYIADTLSLDVAQEFFGGMSTLNLGFTRGADRVGARSVGFFDRARHWQYRIGLAQVLSPRWIASANLEVISDSGYLGSPYRVARVFGAAVPERVPRTRTSRALKLQAVGDLGSRDALRLELRAFQDTWDIRALTLEAGYSRHVGERWLLDLGARWHQQRKALFYSDDATAETLYVTRNRQLGTARNLGLSSRLSYSLPRRWGFVQAPTFSGALELKRFDFEDYTDLRTGLPYRHPAALLQLMLSGSF